MVEVKELVLGEAPRSKRILIQTISCVIANLVILSPGMGLGMSAVMIPQLRSENSTVRISDSEASWIASIFPIFTPVGSILIGMILKISGRKTAIISVNLCSIIGWLLLAMPQKGKSMVPIYLGRALTGISLGMATASANIYSAEISEKSLRGMFISWTSVFAAFSVFLVYGLGWVVKDYKDIAFFGSMFPLMSVILSTVFLNESPSWLLSKGYAAEAEESLYNLRGVFRECVPVAVQEELELLKRAALRKRIRVPPNGFLKTFGHLLKTDTIKPYVIMNTFFFFQQFSGAFVVIFYAVEIVKEMGIPANEYMVATLIGFVRFLATIPTGYISTKFGRRPPSVLSGVGMTISMALISLYLFVDARNIVRKEIIESLAWFPPAGLIFYILSSTLGFMTFPWAMIGELYPFRLRGIATGITTGMAYIISFIILKVYPSMLNHMHLYGVFLFYSLMSLVGTFFVLLYLPETNRKTLKQIEEYFLNKCSHIALTSAPEVRGIELVENSRKLFFEYNFFVKAVILNVNGGVQENL